MEPAGRGSSGRAMHFRRGTPTYRQIHTKIRCNRTHTHAQWKIHIQMYVYRRNAALGEECSGTLYTHTHKYIYIFSSLGRCFQRRLMGWAASGVGAGGQGAAARVVCVPLSHLKHWVFNQFSHKYVCVYPKAWNYWFSFLFNLKLTSSDATL